MESPVSALIFWDSLVMPFHTTIFPPKNKVISLIARKIRACSIMGVIIRTFSYFAGHITLIYKK